MTLVHKWCRKWILGFLVGRGTGQKAFEETDSGAGQANNRANHLEDRPSLPSIAEALTSAEQCLYRAPPPYYWNWISTVDAMATRKRARQSI